MKCREALQLLYEYLDRQLGDAQVDEIKEHLAKCKNCCDTYNFEENLNNLIRQKSRQDVSSEVVNLKSKVLDMIHKEDPEAEPGENSKSTTDIKGKSKGNNSPFFRLKPLMGVAALFLIAVVSLYFYFSSSNKHLQAEVLNPFLKNHELALTGGASMDIADSNPDVIASALAGKMVLPRHVFMADSNCHPAMGRVDTSEGCPYAQIIYDVYGSEVSVFVMKKEDNPEMAKMMSKKNNADVNFIELDSKSMVVWQCEAFWYVAIGDLNQDRFETFVSHFTLN